MYIFGSFDNSNCYQLKLNSNNKYEKLTLINNYPNQPYHHQIFIIKNYIYSFDFKHYLIMDINTLKWIKNNDVNYCLTQIQSHFSDPWSVATSQFIMINNCNDENTVGTYICFTN